MELLATVRAKLQAGKAQALMQAEPVPAPKLFPLRNQDQNRLVQVMHRESFSASDIYTTKLHRGILNDWLGGFEVHGAITLPSSAILSIANAALWNSRARFEAICAAASPPRAPTTPEFGSVRAQDAQCLCLLDFTLLVQELPVLDTREGGIPQSHATCIQTVLGDNLLVAVYHKLRDGSVRQIAKARIADIAHASSAHLTSLKFASEFDVTLYEKLRHCYDLPPSLVESALQRAAGQVPGQGGALKLRDAQCYWVNNLNLAALWGSKRRAELHCSVSADGQTVAVGLLSAGEGSFFSRIAFYAEFALVSACTDQLSTFGNSTAAAPMLELTSAWVEDQQDLNSPLPASSSVAEACAQSLLLVGDAAECAALQSHFPGMTVECTPIPLLLDSSAVGEVGRGAERGSGESKTADALFDTVIVIIPAVQLEGQVDLARVLNLLRDVCQRSTRLIVLSLEGPASSPASPLAEVFAGAMITAQLEYLKCSLCLCRVTTASNVSTTERAAVTHQVLLHELRAESPAGRELEVCYHHAAGAPLRRLVRRYSPVLPSVSQRGEPVTAAAKDEADFTVVNAGDVNIITGGLGGLGLLTARCLVENGARKLVLVSRSGKVPYQGQGLENQLRTLTETPGVTVRLLQCDVSAEDQVVRMLSQARELGPLGGIIHAAGVLSDGLIVTGKAAQGASAVWDAKAKSAHLLHKHTSGDLRVRLFLTYSSVTSAVGTAGQAAYAGANRYLEWLVQERVRSGLAGLCIRWPEVSGVGMAAALHGSAPGGSADRTCAISAAQAGAYQRELLGRTVKDHANAPVVTLMPPALLELYSPAVVGKQFAALQLCSASPVPLTAADRSNVTCAATDSPFIPLPTEAQVRGSVHRILSALLEDGGAGELRDDALLMQTGLDSLGATELSSQLSSEFGLKVPPTLIFSFPTVKEIVGYILAALVARSQASSAVRQVVRTVAPTAALPASTVALLTGTTAITLDEVAIIGTSLSFPGNCSSLPRLWEILTNKESTSVLTPPDRWDVDALLAANRIRDPGCKARLQSAHFLTHEEPFNCQQFNVTAKEAAVMHPSHKLLLINCQRALEDAGYAGDKLCANTGVYVGIGGVVSGTGSAAASVASGDEKIPSAATKLPTMSAYSATSHSVSVSAGRISFSLGLSGPCMAIDTACSSSLVALHAARRALQLGECDLALVCGVNCLDPSSSLACAVAGMTSPDGVCRTFDAQANGYSRAEGCGVVVLKRLGDAVRDADAVYSVVKGSSVKQDGKSASLTAPNGKAQQDLLLSALRDAHLQPGDVSLLETHGTGTKLGDPVEIAALSAVFSARPSVDRPLYLTAVKANVGHVEAGAGMAGLFSILLALQHRTAPPNALLKTLNEDVRGAIGDASMVPITSCTPLESRGARRLVAGVSSFGYSGTIAHVLLQEAPEGVRRRAMSVASDSAATCGTTLINPGDTEVAPAAVKDDTGEYEKVFDDESEGEESDDAHDQVWQFSGQGDMRVGAGKDLWDTEESFRAAMIECDTIVRPLLGKGISELLYPPGCVATKPNPASTAAAVKSAAVQAAEALLAQTVYSQAALVALEYCLAAVWLAQGVQPDIVLGHSLGEYAAAVVAGVLTLTDALTLVCERGRLVQENAGCQGVMYAVRTTAEDITAALSKADACTLSAASVAACNGKLSYVLSGSEVAVKQLISLLPRTGSIRLGVAHAFHSPLMGCIAEPFRKVLAKVRFSPLRAGVTFVSTVRGRAVSSAELADPQYWIDHMLLPVQFTAAVECAWRAGGGTFLEMGPQDTLTKLATRALEAVAKEESGGGESRAFETMASLC